MSVWSKQKVNDWQMEQPYFIGTNFYPSTAINQLEMWQEDSFDPITIKRELEYAQKIGMNLMRVYLHDLLWDQDSKGLCERIDQYLSIADNLEIKTMFVLFDDCWNQNFSLGKQPDPKPYTHNSGWVQSPGVKVVNDSTKWPRLEKYVKGILERYKSDERVAVWDLYNEPGNGKNGDDKGEDSNQGDRSLPFLKTVYNWARQVQGLAQPLTIGIWKLFKQYKELNKFALESSDIITFHSYDPPQQLANKINDLAQHNRPMICTEYMARGVGSTFEYCLPIMKKYNVGAISWGLVAGKSQTTYPWKWNPSKGEPDIFFHDVFKPDGTFLYSNEENIFKQL